MIPADGWKQKSGYEDAWIVLGTQDSIPIVKTLSENAHGWQCECLGRQQWYYFMKVSAWDLYPNTVSCYAAGPIDRCIYIFSGSVEKDAVSTNHLLTIHCLLVMQSMMFRYEIISNTDIAFRWGTTWIPESFWQEVFVTDSALTRRFRFGYPLKGCLKRVLIHRIKKYLISDITRTCGK